MFDDMKVKGKHVRRKGKEDHIVELGVGGKRIEVTELDKTVTYDYRTIGHFTVDGADYVLPMLTVEFDEIFVEVEE